MPNVDNARAVGVGKQRGGEINNMQAGVFHVFRDMMENHATNKVTCCVPSGCIYEAGEVIRTDNLSAAVKIVCNNEQCAVGTYMHRDCFETWEQSVLTYLRSTGRARSWSEKQRLQNLWTKKGYDLAFKACGCKCGKGHLRKDLNWLPPTPKTHAQEEQNAAAALATANRKKKPRKKRNDKPVLGNASSVVVMATAAAANANVVGAYEGGRPMLRIRSNSMSSTGSSPPSGASSTGDSPKSPTHVSILSGSPGNNGIIFLGGGAAALRRRRSNSERNGGGGLNSNIFSRRADYSSFNMLPRHKINSYHIKMEDEGNCGNDETRCFVLSNLAAARLARVTCVLCNSSMLIFDQYPLIDGTFFLSPRQHSHACLQVKVDGKRLFMGAVCMGCLEGWNCVLRCTFCLKKWQGTSLILGTMYSYDIFAANPCCMDRLTCNYCHKLVVMPEQRCNFFSDYSNSLPCPHCEHVDYHFVKSLNTYIRGEHD